MRGGGVREEQWKSERAPHCVLVCASARALTCVRD